MDIDVIINFPFSIIYHVTHYEKKNIHPIRSRVDDRRSPI